MASWTLAADGIEKDVVDATLSHGDGAVVLLHTWPGPTVQALPRIVERLRAAGAQFITVAEVTDGG